MEQMALPIVITGHIDHGKSTLIGRLLYDTGVLKEDRYREIIATSSQLGKHTEFAFALDALEEERERGITIDTTQIYFQTPKRKYLIIDAPGHKEFLRNMITGASYAEAAVLIVDAKEGVKEQTKRHAYLLGLVGIKQVCVLINKMDLVEYSRKAFEGIRREIEEFFAPLSIQPKFFIPICALSGKNVAQRDSMLEWYQGASLLEALDGLEYNTFEKRPFRFPVQDLYDHESQKILAGRIESGEALRGMDLFVLPGGRKAKIKEIKKFMQGDIPKASYGECIGIVLDPIDGANLSGPGPEGGGLPSTPAQAERLYVHPEPGLSVPPSKAALRATGWVKRGDILSGDRQASVTKSFGAHVFWFEGTYREHEKMKIRLTTQESDCRMVLHNKFDPATMDKKTEGMDRLELGEVAKVTISTDTEIVVDPFSTIPEMGRFVIEKDGIPVGGGIVA